MNDAVLELVRYGFTVFPLQPKSKVPYPESWIALQCKSEEEVKERLTPRFAANSNHAVAMGRASGIIGLDIDYDDGADPELLKRLPVSWTAKSGKGHHVFYKYPSHWPEIGLGRLVMGKTKDKNGKLKACVSLRGNGHYFVGVGSIHPETGARYEWAKYEGWDDKVSVDLLCPEELGLLQDAPDFLLDAIGAEEERKREPGEKYHENGRHAMFVATATAMRKEGRSEAEIYGRLVERNREDCLPPKENAEKELRNVAKWVCMSVIPNGPRSLTPSPDNGLQPSAAAQEARKILGLEALPAKLEGIRPLGHHEGDYFYMSDKNQQITKLAYSSHSNLALINLMPLSYWRREYGNEKGTVDWGQAASDMMQACLTKGVYDAKRIRGEGPWMLTDSDERDFFGASYAVHLGRQLWTQGRLYNLLDVDSRNTYRLGPDLSAPAETAATLEDCQLLLKACQAPSWVDPQSAILLAGSLALLRISGALPWRPHVWLTGAAGTGKSTLMDSLVSNMVGDWGIHVQGDTSSAGIRQRLGCRSIPVIFDESEAQDKKGASRMQGILELARQASSEGAGRILKGTPSGNALEFKVNSSFFLASIKVGLVQEADVTRFTVLKLDRPSTDTLKSAAFFQAVGAVTAEVADRIARRMLDRYDELLANYKMLHSVISQGSSARCGQQYGMLLAGYAVLVQDTQLREGEARELVERAGIMAQHRNDSAMPDEVECLDHLLQSSIKIALEGDGGIAKEHTVQKALEGASGEVLVQLQAYGMVSTGSSLIVANRHPALAKIFSNTKWASGWKLSLERLKDAEPGVRVRFEKTNPKQATSVPMKHIFDGCAPDYPDAPY